MHACGCTVTDRFSWPRTPMAEGTSLKLVTCRFESDRGYMDRDNLLALLAAPRPPAVPPGCVPSGSPALDLLLGGGWPHGGISEIRGPSGCGATTLACRTIGAAQTAFPDRTVVLCSREIPGAALMRRCGITAGRLLLTQDPAAALGCQDAALAVIDGAGQAELPVRARPGLTVLCLTRAGGAVRSGTCVRLGPEPGARGWSAAACAWQPRAAPAAGHALARVCLGSHPCAQEILGIAAETGAVTVRGRWYSRGGRDIGGSWEKAVHALAASGTLRMQIFAAVMPSASPVYYHLT